MIFLISDRLESNLRRFVVDYSQGSYIELNSGLEKYITVLDLRNQHQNNGGKLTLVGMGFHKTNTVQYFSYILFNVFN